MTMQIPRQVLRGFCLASVSIFVVFVGFNVSVSRHITDEYSNDDAEATSEIYQIRSPNDMTSSQVTANSSKDTKYMWPDDPLCSRHTVKFGKNVDGVWLLTFPRSGNTWTRYLIESATGIFTGSVYNSKFQLGLGNLGETDPIHRNRTIAIKTHEVKSLRGSNKKVLIIIRNPARCIISFWNYSTQKGIHAKWFSTVDDSTYTTAAFHRFVRNKLKIWMSMYKYALENSQRLHVVFYEMLRENPLREIRDILRFLQIPPDEDRLLCISRHLEGFAKGSQRQVEPYTLEEKEVFAKSFEEINALLRSRGFSPLPDYQKYGLV